MLTIRLQRIGKKHQASFRIVLQDSQWKPQGKALELLGFYNPHSKEKQFQAERIKFWIARGAQLSPTLHNMLVDAGIVAGEKVKAWKVKKGKAGEVKAEVKSAAAPVIEQKEATAAESVGEGIVSNTTEVVAQ